MAVGGVWSELVSGVNSLLTGKNTGNFCNFGAKFLALLPDIRLRGRGL
jgi:hypothetical protein